MNNPLEITLYIRNKSRKDFEKSLLAFAKKNSMAKVYKNHNSRYVFLTHWPTKINPSGEYEVTAKYVSIFGSLYCEFRLFKISWLQVGSRLEVVITHESNYDFVNPIRELIAWFYRFNLDGLQTIEGWQNILADADNTFYRE